MCTLPLTDVHSGWTETRALLNKAHRWVKEAIKDVKKKLLFQMKGIDSVNGSEFKNTQLLQWCNTNNVIFTRSRSHNKEGLISTMQLALSKNAASLPYGKHRFIVCTFSLRCKSTQIHQSATFDSQSALADKINRFLTEQADRLDKVCG